MRFVRRPPETILPCVRCGNPGGTKRPPEKGGLPRRYRAERWGLDGEVCQPCYHALLPKPDASSRPYRRWRDLVKAVQAFAAAMDAPDADAGTEASQRFREMVALATTKNNRRPHADG